MGNIFLFVILFVYGFAVILMGCVALKNKKYKNKVHFYVARDKDGKLWLYLSKPRRLGATFGASERGNALTSSKYFSKYGLSVRDFDSLKGWDEPVEVFLNLDD